MIRYLQHKAIDLEKWDACLCESANGIVYGHSWFLDKISPGWEALVLDDYRTVMPLTWRKKFGMYYLYQPLFTQQLGVFSKDPVDQKMVDLFFQEIPGKFRYIDICLNSTNPVPPNGKKIEKVTYQLSLNRPYEDIAKDYNDNTKRNLKKAHKNNLSITEGLSPAELIKFKRENSDVSIADTDYERIKEVMQHAIDNDQGKILGVYHEGELCGATFFLSDERYGIYLLTDSSDLGKKKRAMVLLIDHYIKTNSGQEKILDFEGSVIPGIAFFFKGFGAKPVAYHHVRINKLPWPLSMVKR